MTVEEVREVCLLLTMCFQQSRYFKIIADSGTNKQGAETRRDQNAYMDNLAVQRDDRPKSDGRAGLGCH